MNRVFLGAIVTIAPLFIDGEPADTYGHCQATVLRFSGADALVEILGGEEVWLPLRRIALA